VHFPHRLLPLRKYRKRNASPETLSKFESGSYYMEI
jgi:hypothetical protein